MTDHKFPSLSATDRRARRTAVHDALMAGHPPPGATRIGNRANAVTEAAKRIGIKRQSMRGWCDREEAAAKDLQPNFAPNWNLYQPPEVATDPAKGTVTISSSPESVRITQLEDECRRLKSELRGAHREALEEDAVRDLIGSLSATVCAPPNWTSKPEKTNGARHEVPVAIWSDWHLGEVVSREETGGVNEYNPTIAERRIRNLVDSTIHLCRDHGPGDYPGIVINLLGDFISGGLHPELLRTDADGVMQSVVRARDILVWALETMADEFGRVFCPCAAGNHGRNTAKPEFKGYLHHNFDWLIYQMLARHFENDARIQFMIPSSNECHYRVFGERFLAMHGDMLGVKGGDGIIGAIGPIMRGEFKTRGQASATDRHYDVLLMGHYHQQLWLPRAIVANSIKGFDEYVKNALRAIPSEPSQPLFFVHPTRGITSRWNVEVEDRKSHTKAEWLTWEDAA